MAYKDLEKKRAKDRRAYHRNKERIKPKRKKFENERREWIQGIKSSIGCLECGERHPGVLDFHHVTLGKTACVSKLYNKRKERVLREISLCEVLCANCHRKRHWERHRRNRKTKRN